MSNIKGWSDFSEVSYILSAYVPDKPNSKPEFISVDADSITLSLSSLSQSNGDIATHYALYMQTDFTGTPTLLETYTVDNNNITLVAADEGLTAGQHYFFYYELVNSQGNSPASDIIEIALADYPTAPTTLTKDDLMSSENSIFIKWESAAETQINVIGYELWMDRGSDGYFS